MPTDIFSIKRTVFSNDKHQQSNCIFDMGVVEEIDLPVYVILGS